MSTRSQRMYSRGPAYRPEGLSIIRCQRQAEACQPIDSEARGPSELERVEQPIYGGVDLEEGDPFISSTLALFSKVDLEYGFAQVDGSATLISPTVALGAAHTCALFHPQFASLGPYTPNEDEASFER